MENIWTHFTRKWKCTIFLPSLYAFPCRIKTSTTYCSSLTHHTSRIVSRQVRPAQPQNITLNQYEYTFAFWSRLFSCFAAWKCEVQELPEEEAHSGDVVAILMTQCVVCGDRHVVETFWNTIQTGEWILNSNFNCRPQRFYRYVRWELGQPDVSISLAMTQLGQVRVDLEDPAALATFLVTANIKLIRAEWLGDALDAISKHTAAGRLNLRNLTMSAISEGSIWFNVNLNFGRLQGHTSKQSSMKRGVLFWILCVVRMITPTMDPTPIISKTFRSSSQTEEIPNYFSRVVATALWTRFGGFLECLQRCSRKFHIFGCWTSHVTFLPWSATSSFPRQVLGPSGDRGSPPAETARGRRRKLCGSGREDPQCVGGPRRSPSLGFGVARLNLS